MNKLSKAELIVMAQYVLHQNEGGHSLKDIEGENTTPSIHHNCPRRCRHCLWSKFVHVVLHMLHMTMLLHMLHLKMLLVLWIKIAPRGNQF